MQWMHRQQGACLKFGPISRLVSFLCVWLSIICGEEFCFGLMRCCDSSFCVVMLRRTHFLPAVAVLLLHHQQEVLPACS